KNLPGKYAPPAGRLYLARDKESVAGSIALRSLGPDACEMKRLFVREEYRGMQIGKMLIERLVDDAREIGYKAMCLDTFPPKMGKAVRLYESYGFREIPPYYDNPHEGVLFMELKL
ncbi:MAG: GNAT family N-acetyltransferase, partial [Pyrinomonadaceae bacterium]